MQESVAAFLELMDRDFDAALQMLADGRRQLADALGPAAPPSLLLPQVMESQDTSSGRALRGRARGLDEDRKGQRQLRGALTQRRLSVTNLNLPRDTGVSVPVSFSVQSLANAANGGRMRNGQIVPQSLETVDGVILPSGTIVLTDHRLVY